MPRPADTTAAVQTSADTLRTALAKRLRRGSPSPTDTLEADDSRCCHSDTRPVGPVADAARSNAGTAPTRRYRHAAPGCSDRHEALATRTPRGGLCGQE